MTTTNAVTDLLLIEHGGFEMLEIRDDVPATAAAKVLITPGVAANYPLTDGLPAQIAFLEKNHTDKIVLEP